MKLYHATTHKKAKLYAQTGQINKPVRGFTTLEACIVQHEIDHLNGKLI